MKRIKNADINFKINPKKINLNNFSMRFFTVNSQAYFFIKDQNNLVSVERDATIYDEDVIISGGTKVLDYYLPLDWSELVQLGEGVLNYRCINNIEDPFFPDMTYNQVVEDTTGYYIDSDIHVDPSEDRNLIERVSELESTLAVEEIDREEADTFISGAVDTEIARAISAETELSEALQAESDRAISAETALQDAIDAEEARAIAIENAIRQDLTDETELRTSADTVILATVNDEIVRATSADTALDNKIDVETLRAIGVENAISGNLETYKATNNAALQAETTRATSAETKIATDLSNYIASNNHALADEVSRATSAETALNNALTAETAARESEVTRATAAENAISGVVDNYITTNNAAVQGEITRATSAETALQNAIGDETTARANADAALSTRIDNLSSASTAAIEAEEARAREAESGLTTALNNEVSRATSAETIIANSLNGEITRATSAETALNNQIDAEVLRATAAEADLEAKIGVVSGATELINAETARAVIVENALSGAIDSISAATSGSVEELDAKIDTVSGNVITETTRATTAEEALSGAIDTLDVRFFDDAKYEDSGNTKVINFYNGNVVKATIDATDFIKDGMISTVELIPSGSTSVLVITWNTDGGSKVTTIDIGDIFEADNYYQKSETSGKTEIANALALKLNISDFNTYSGAVDTAINSKASQSDFTAHTADSVVHITAAERTAWNAKADESAFTAHTSDSVIHVTSSDKEKWNKVDDKADTTALTAVNAVLTAHTSDTTIHVTTAQTAAWSAKQNALTAGSGISIVSDVISVTGGGITSGEVQSMIESATTPISQTIEDNEEVTAQALNVLNGELANKLDVSAYTPVDLSNYYTKSETSGATEISTALSGKQDTLSAGTNITISGNVISASDTYISGVTVGNVLPKPNIEPNTTTITFLDGTVLTGQSLDLRTITNITNAVRIDANVQGRNILQDSDGDLDLHNLEILTIQMSNIDVYQPYAYVGICPYAFSNTELGRIDNSKLKVYIYCDTPTDVYFKTYDEINDAAFRGGSTALTYPIYVPNVEEFSNSVVRSDRNYDNITWGQLFGNRLHQMTGVEKILKFSYNADKEDIMLPTSAITDGISIEASSAITEGDTNPVQGGVLYDELRIGSETEVTLEWLNYDGGETTNYPSGSGCSKITFEVVESGETEGNEWNQTEGWFSVSDIEGNVYIGINDGVVTASAENGFPATCSVNGNIVTVEYPTIVDNVEKWYSSYDNHWVTKAVFLGGTPVRVIDQVTANTASIANKLDASAYTPTDLSQYWTSAQTSSAINQATSGKVNSNDVYLKSETSGATQIATAIAAKADPYTAGTGIDITNNVISVTGGTGGGISSAECQTMIDQSISGKANSSDVYTKSETSGKTEISTALAGKSDTGHTHDDRYYTETEINNRLGGLTFWKGTQSAYDNLQTKDNNTLYVIVG